MKMAPEGIKISNLLLKMPALGQLSGEGSMAADQSLNFSMQALLSPSGSIGVKLTKLTKRSDVPIPFLIRGTASDPKFVPDAKNTLRSLLGSALTEKGSDEEQSKKGGAIGNALRNLIKKKKQ